MITMSVEIRINVRTTAEIKRDLEITARLRGLTVSSLVNFLVVKAIREEKELAPQAFSVKSAENSASNVRPSKEGVGVFFLPVAGTIGEGGAQKERGREKRNGKK